MLAPSPSSRSLVGSAIASVLRFKWAGFSALVVFLAVYWIDAWFVRHGLRRDATLLDDFLLGALVFALGIGQQLRHEIASRRQQRLMKIIADMNHHTRNALQVIVGRSTQSIPDPSAIDDIRQAVRRIDWCLREILPGADDRNTKKALNANSSQEQRMAKGLGG